jgi:FAD:protein FMN transferase
MILGYQEIAQVMGVTATITVHATNAAQLVQKGHQMLAHYEQLWSRFLPSSDISRLNNADGGIIEVDAETSELIATMRTVHKETEGLFNPTLLPIQLRHGDSYSLTSDALCVVSNSAQPWENLDDISFHSPTSVSLPAAMTLDAGGIAKGFAADKVAHSLMHLGATSVSVNIGGDTRVINGDESTHDWNFDVCTTAGDIALSTVSLRNGAIATSAMNARHRGNRGPERHVFSQHGSFSEIALCSVIAENATWAEAWTKLLFFSSDIPSDIHKRDLAALVVDIHGHLFQSEKWKEYTL